MRAPAHYKGKGKGLLLPRNCIATQRPGWECCPCIPSCICSHGALIGTSTCVPVAVHREHFTTSPPALQIDVATGDKYYQGVQFVNGKMVSGDWKR